MSDGLLRRPDALALAAAILLAAGAAAPSLAMRESEAWGRAAAAAASPPAADRSELAGALREGIGAREALDASPLVPPTGRPLGPPLLPAAAEVVADLDGSVARGMLAARWHGPPGSRGTRVRVEGHGGPVVEREVAAGTDTLEVPVPAASGTISVVATPILASGPGEPSRVSIPFRIPVEVVRVESASRREGGASVVLRRDHGGNPVEATARVGPRGRVAARTAPGPRDLPVEFPTDFVLEAVRPAAAPAAPLVPLFEPDGRVRRDHDGEPVYAPRPDGPPALEVVLRGPGDARLVLPVERPLP
jgi:hypothetical protein